MKVMTEVISSLKILKVFPQFIWGKCRCGCNEDIPLRTSNGYIRKHKYRHSCKRSKHILWKNGFKTTKKGYDCIHKPNYYSANSSGDVPYHRWTYEQFYKCCLLKWVDIHHVNGDKHDNTIMNLKPLPHKEHPFLNRKDVSDRRCILCGKLTYIYKNGWAYWRRHPITKEEWICYYCYKKIKRRIKSIK